MRLLLRILLPMAAAMYAAQPHAMLLDRGPDMVYDNVLNITWTRNANLPGSSGLSLGAAEAWAANLVLGGFDDWRLPYGSVNAGVGPINGADIVNCAEASELSCRDNEMGYMFYHDLGGSSSQDKTGTQTALGGQRLTGIQPGSYWTTTNLITGGEFQAVSVFRFSGGSNFGGVIDFPATNSAWAVRAGDVAAVPEPAAIVTLAVGVLGLLLRGRPARRL